MTNNLKKIGIGSFSSHPKFSDVTILKSFENQDTLHQLLCRKYTSPVADHARQAFLCTTVLCTTSHQQLPQILEWHVLLILLPRKLFCTSYNLNSFT